MSAGFEFVRQLLRSRIRNRGRLRLQTFSFRNEKCVRHGRERVIRFRDENFFLSFIIIKLRTEIGSPGRGTGGGGGRCRRRDGYIINVTTIFLFNVSLLNLRSYRRIYSRSTEHDVFG